MENKFTGVYYVPQKGQPIGRISADGQLKKVNSGRGKIAFLGYNNLKPETFYLMELHVSEEKDRVTLLEYSKAIPLPVRWLEMLVHTRYRDQYRFFIHAMIDLDEIASKVQEFGLTLDEIREAWDPRHFVYPSAYSSWVTRIKESKSKVVLCSDDLTPGDKTEARRFYYQGETFSSWEEDHNNKLRYANLSYEVVMDSEGKLSPRRDMGLSTDKGKREPYVFFSEFRSLWEVPVTPGELPRGYQPSAHFIQGILFFNKFKEKKQDLERRLKETSDTLEPVIGRSPYYAQALASVYLKNEKILDTLTQNLFQEMRYREVLPGSIIGFELPSEYTEVSNFDFSKCIDIWTDSGDGLVIWGNFHFQNQVREISPQGIEKVEEVNSWVQRVPILLLREQAREFKRFQEQPYWRPDTEIWKITFSVERRFFESPLVPKVGSQVDLDVYFSVYNAKAARLEADLADSDQGLGSYYGLHGRPR